MAEKVKAVSFRKWLREKDYDVDLIGVPAKGEHNELFFRLQEQYPDEWTAYNAWLKLIGEI